jgi:hypothetical protein
LEEGTLTELAYERIGRIESRKRRLWVVIVASALIASLGLVLNGAAFVAITNQKGDISSYIALIAIATIGCIIFALFGINRYMLVKNFSKKLEEFELLEETIYSEVVKPRMNQFK